MQFIQNIQTWMDQYPWLDMFVSLCVLIFIAIFANFFAKRVVVRGIRSVIAKLPFIHTDIAQRHSFIARIANIVPAIILMNGINSVPHLSLSFIQFIQIASQAFIFLTIALAISELLNAFNMVYQKKPQSKNKPIKGYLQLIKLIIYIICGLLILGVLLQKSVFNLLAGFGAMAAVLMLVFQNTILSLVASIQISSYDMVRLGDWIEMPSLNADGDVIDISLHTVTVQNFDKTITTIPTNKLVTDTFRNWRGMQETGARRIKRSIFIDQSSVHFLTEQQINKLKMFNLLDEYLAHKEQEISAFNHHLSKPNIHNQRRLTNLGTFRHYVQAYLSHHPKISQNLTLLVRQLQPTNEGLPIEIYAFTNTTVWGEYENIQSDIFDHLIAILPEFGLRIQQSPSGYDVQQLATVVSEQKET